MKERHLISMEERTFSQLFPSVITMRDVIDSTLMHINKGNAHGSERRGNANVRLSLLKHDHQNLPFRTFQPEKRLPKILGDLLRVKIC